MGKLKKPKVRNRYSIGEWHGLGFDSLSSTERFARAKIECEANAIRGVLCPFQIDTKCDKKGGVCSLRQYQQAGEDPVLGVGPVITTCPGFALGSRIRRWSSSVNVFTRANSHKVLRPFKTFLEKGVGRLLHSRIVKANDCFEFGLRYFATCHT